MKDLNISSWAKRVAPKAIVCVALVLIGFGGLALAAVMKKPPVEVKSQERPLAVEVIKATAEDVTPVIVGHGEIRSSTTVPVAAEIPGCLVHVNPRLEKGNTITEGEILFSIDPRDYRAALDEALSAVSRTEATLRILKKRSEIDATRLQTARRNRELAQKHLQRVRGLLENDQVGSTAETEKVEQAFNSAKDLEDRLAGAVSLYPSEIEEAKSALRSAQARAAVARANLGRCEVRASFAARIKTVNAERGQYVRPGERLLLLADDSDLEISVSLDSRQVRQWLSFDAPEREAVSRTWFDKPRPVACTIRWTEADAGPSAVGRLDRIVEFCPETRTVTAAVRIGKPGDDAVLPLVEGMFCRVEIPGSAIRNVFRVPRTALNTQDRVRVARNGRLETVPVSIAYAESEHVFVSRGVETGDQVIVTRLVDPLEGTLLDVADATELQGGEQE